MRYQRPLVSDFGSIAHHTFNNPGAGDKSGKERPECDKFGEFGAAPFDDCGNGAAVSP